jgi:multiple sugar transport system permease protein
MRGAGRHGASTFVFLLPWLLTFAVFSLYPLLSAFYTSFTHYRIVEAGAPRFVGFDNYARLLRDPLFWKSLLNTLIFVVGTIPLTTVGALLVALGLNRRLPLRGLFRAGYFMPTIVSIVVVALIFKNFYAPFGFFNATLRALGLSGHPWLQDPKTALAAVMIMDVWAAIGYYAIIYLAGLQAIPAELYEAAALDGGTGWQKNLYITLPLLKSTTLFILVINTIRSFQVFIEIFVMTRGGPLDSTLTSVFYLYDRAFTGFELGYASALAYVLFAVTLGASVVYVRFLRDKETA